MTYSPNTDEPKNLYELSWACAQDAKVAVNLATGLLIDVNPAAVALTGYSREELLGMEVSMLHPEAEREQVKVEFGKSLLRPAPHFDLHVQRKDGRCVPVAIWSSKKFELDGRSLVIGEFRDISEEKVNEHRLAAQNWALTAFSTAALALGRAQNTAGLLQAICEAITYQSHYVLAWVGIAEDDPDKKIRVVAAAGSSIAYLEGIHLSWAEDEQWGQSPTGVCIRTNTLQITGNTWTSPVFSPWRARAKRFKIRSSFSTPLHVEGGWHGVLVVYASRINAFEAAPVGVFQDLAEQVSYGIRALEQKQLLEAERLSHEETQKQLSVALSASVAAIVTAMEMRDPHTAGHQARVAEIAVAIGKEMGWSKDRLLGLRMAAMVHDIGKISIPAEILTKPTRLSKGEWALIREHPETGFTILKDIPFTWPIADIVRQHHEKLDGSGYPFGLKGDSILPEAKILAVADIVEAMAADRPYRAALGLELALAEIKALAGTLLDAEVVRICTYLFREKRLSLRTAKHV
jgi:PAS domain S-box-containing protein/putative nucleotidyltransferase with HDIG domain